MTKKTFDKCHDNCHGGRLKNPLSKQKVRLENKLSKNVKGKYFSELDFMPMEIQELQKVISFPAFIPNLSKTKI